ncbi:alpha/beta hydrolase [Deltaproteobacteria bacterium OttesenSCG-928-K17]|nr:alpha/beta hydrolase [Deltaproteobacteria bacterium OttesenSCG-928-K17]
MKIKSIMMAFVLALFLAGPALALDLPDKFDYLGPEMKHFANKAGRDLIYIDEGEKDWRAVVFCGGSGTSVQAFYMTEFLRTLRLDLKLRVISLGRNGFGMTEFVPGQNFQDYASDVKELLDHLGVEKFAVVGISGGGPYVQNIADLMPERVVSLHFAAAFSNVDNGMLSSCKAMKEDAEKYKGKLTSWIQNPMVWWDLGKNTSIHKIPAFQDTANNEGAHSFFIRGQMGDPAPAIHEYTMFCTAPAAEGPSKVTAPVFMYYGTADKSVTPSHADFWKKHYQNSASQTLRLYPDEGHDVQYRHWDQILLDMAGLGDKTLICQGDKAELAAPAEADKLVKDGKAIYGICAWK